MTALLFGRFVLLSVLVALGIAFTWVTYLSSGHSR